MKTGDVLYGIKERSPLEGKQDPEIVTATVERVTAKLVFVGRCAATAYASQFSRELVDSGRSCSDNGAALFTSLRAALDAYGEAKMVERDRQSRLLSWKVSTSQTLRDRGDY